MKEFIITIIVGVPWVFGIMVLIVTLFGKGASSGDVSLKINEQTSLIKQCEINLPRDQFCELIAVPSTEITE